MLPRFAVFGRRRAILTSSLLLWTVVAGLVLALLFPVGHSADAGRISPTSLAASETGTTRAAGDDCRTEAAHFARDAGGPRELAASTRINLHLSSITRWGTTVVLGIATLTFLAWRRRW